jgi:uncharacterized protein
MSDSRDNQEPSMEEILSSIRRIIADEEGDEPASKGSAGAGQRGARPEPAFDADEASEDDDVLDLTQRVEEDGEVVDLNARVTHATETPGEGREDDDRDEIDEVELEPDEPEFRPEPVREPPAPAREVPAPPVVAGAAPRQPEPRDRPQPEQKDRPTVSANQRTRDALVDESAAGAASNAFAKFAQAVTPTPSDQRVASSDGRTVEEFAEDILRPLLKEWLDENLPAIVERVVEREVNKIARRAELL